MTYVPNAQDTSQPTGDKSVQSAAQEFRTLKGFTLIVDEALDAFQAQLDALQTAIGAGDNSVALAANLGARTGSTLVGTAHTLGGSETRTVAQALSNFVCIFDFLTAAEIADVKANTAVFDLQAKIQAVLDLTSAVWFPEGTYRVGSPLNCNDYQAIRCASRKTIFLGGFSGPVFRGKNDTTQRRFGILIDSGKITHGSRAIAGSIAIDFKSSSMCKVFGTLIQETEFGWKNGGTGALGAFYNECHGVDISGVVTGVENGTLGNDCKMFGGRINDSVTGTRDNDCSGNLYDGVAIEVFTLRGHLNSDVAAATNIKYAFSRLENLPSTGIGIDVRALAQNCMYIFPQFTGLATDVLDVSAGQDSNGWSDLGLAVKSASPVKGIGYRRVTRDVASVPANSFRQEGPITVTGVRVNDAVSVSPPTAWPTNLQVGSAWCSSADTVYFGLKNESGAPIDPPSGDFAFSWVRG